MSKVAVIILNWNGWKDTIECLHSIEILRYYPPHRRAGEITKLEVIVVDNGSRDESVEKIKSQKLKVKSHSLKLKIIANKENLGFAEGNNVGIRYALEKGADYVMLLNNDTLIEKSLVKRLVEIMEKDKKIGIAGPKIYFAAGCEFHHDRYKKEERGKVIWYAGGIIDWENIYCSHRGVDEVDSRQYDRQEETDFVSGCCMIVRREVFESIGLLDKKYYLYLEDVDFCLRAKKAGFKIVYTPQAILWHKNAESSGKPGSPLHVYYQTRNRLFLGMKYASWRVKMALLKESLSMLKAKGAKRRAVLDFYLGRLKKGSNAYLVFGG